MSWRVVRGDCIEAMTAMEPESVHAVVCDPPYGLEFMGKEWDAPWKDGAGTNVGATIRDPATERGGFQDGNGGNPYSRSRIEYGRGNRGESKAFQAWCEAWAREALRVLKPGGFLLAFGGTRTVHRLTSGIEDAGFEIRDTLAWMYGSGFPKSLDVSKAIDKAAGAEREVIGASPFAGRKVNGTWTGGTYGDEPSHGDGPSVTAPATPEAQAWEGWGTALKPAYEPVVVARKPLSGTVAANVVAHGTGALNIAACRIGFRDDDDERESKNKNRHADFKSGPRDNAVFGADLRDRGEHGNYDPPGRWPANVILDEHAAAVLDAQTGDLGRSTGGRVANISTASTIYGGGKGLGQDLRAEDVRGDPGFGDSGGASRYFYVAKASAAERSAGLDGFQAAITDDGRQTSIDNPFLRGETTRRNVHPTVKPIEVMRWLVRLVTPPGGLVLDPFVGSGTTGIACVLEGFDFIGVEREPEYADIAEARIRWWEQHPEGLPLEVALAADGARRKVADTGQVSMFDLLGG